MSPELKAAWRLLELAPGADADELRRAWRDLLLVWHPDRLPEHLRARATEKVKALNHAHELLRAALEGAEPPAAEDVLTLDCARCAGRGVVTTGVTASAHFVVDTCPVCRGGGTLICLADRRCLDCAGHGRKPAGSVPTRAAYLRTHLVGEDSGTPRYRLRYRRLWVRYENQVALCKTCGGAGYTFFRVDARKASAARRKRAKGSAPPTERRRVERRKGSARG
jgi:hypothetical protein